MRRSTYSITRAQSELPQLVRRAERGDLLSISRHDETVAYLLSREQLESLVETIEILANPAARRAISSHRAGRSKFVPLSSLDDPE